MNKGTNQRQMCENCKKIQGDINNVLIHLSSSLVMAEIICKCPCGAIHATGKQINRRVVIKEDSQIVVPQPKIVYKKPN